MAKKNSNGSLDDPLIKGVRFVLKAKAEPRIAVLVTNGLLELMINTLVDAYCKQAKKINDDKREFSYSAKLVLLNEKGVLHDDIFQVLDRFRKLRNRAAHEPFFTLDSHDVRQIAAPVQRGFPNVAERVDEFAADFPSFCQFILMTIHANHQGVLAPQFLPTAHKLIAADAS